MKPDFFLRIAVLLLSTGLLATGAGASLEWTVRNIWPDADQLQTIAYGNGMFVAAGAEGTLLTSPDGTNWTAHSLGTKAGIRGAAFAFGRWVLVGAGTDGYGIILESTDGISWSKVQFDQPFNPLNSITVADGHFVAVGDLGTILRSDEPRIWIHKNSGTFQNLVAITHGNGLFAATGDGGTLVTSSDTGNVWTARSGAPMGFGRIAFGNGRFVTGGGLTSIDAVNWVLTGPSIGPITFGNGKFVALNGEDLLTSTNGLYWEYAPSPNRRTSTVGFGNGLFFLLGSDGAMSTSSDGIAWTDRTLPSAGFEMADVAYGNGAFVAVAPNPSLNATAIVRSTNGSTWTAPQIHTNTWLASITYADGAFVGVSYDTVLISSNGVDWTRQPGNFSPAPFSPFKSTTYGNGLFAAVVQYFDIATSPDGLNWTRRYSDDARFLNAVSYANGRFIVAGQWGTVIVSSDGINWSSRDSGSASDLYDATFANGLYFLVGSSGTILSSPDTITWTAHPRDPLEHLAAIAYGGGTYVISGQLQVGLPYSDWKGLLLTSVNGTDWVRSSFSPEIAAALEHVRLSGIAYGAGTFVAVGGNGVILQSETLAAAELQIQRAQSSPAVNVTVSGQTGRKYVLQSSDRITGSDWTDIFDFTLEGPTTNIPIPLRLDIDQQYFRAVQP
jgi:hypothetical protein